MGLAFTLGLTGCGVKTKKASMDEIIEMNKSDMNRMYEGQEPLSCRISLNEAIARALLYNLDNRVKVYESLVAQHRYETSVYDMLPQLTARAGYNARFSEPGSRSIGVENGQESLRFSRSSSKNTATMGMDLKWNLLDFGMSYLQAKEFSDNKHIADTRRQKVIQNIVLDVKYAYYRAAAAQRLSKRLDMLQCKMRRALQKARAVERQKLDNLLEILEEQKSLIAAMDNINSQKRQLALAETELASLINLRPGEKYKLVPMCESKMIAPDFRAPMMAVEKAALMTRPEVHEEFYKGRIAALEVKKAYWSLVPAISLGPSYDYSSNRFLYKQHWTSFAVNATTNLMRFASFGDRKRLGDAHVAFAKERGLALSMAIIAQVHLAKEKYGILTSEFKHAKSLHNISRRVSRHTDAQKSADAVDEMTVVANKADELIAELNMYNKYADLQNSLDRIYHSVGVNPLPDSIEGADLDTVSKAIGDYHKHLQIRDNIYTLPSYYLQGLKGGA